MRLSLTRILFAILLVFSGPAFGQDTRISVGEIFDGEPFMTINPSNPQHLVVAWMGFDGLDLVQIKVRISLDGGTTWSTPIDIPHPSVRGRTYSRRNRNSLSIHEHDLY